MSNHMRVFLWKTGVSWLTSFSNLKSGRGGVGVLLEVKVVI